MTAQLAAPHRTAGQVSGRSSAAADRMIYRFGKSVTEGHASQRELLGGKGANLAEMSAIGLPVPPGFTITTAVCAEYQANGDKLPPKLMDEVRRTIKFIEHETGKSFGSPSNPLLVSVRSGAAASMPGMMDTVLNLGLTDQSCAGLATATKNLRFAWDAYRRLINMFGDVVMGIAHEEFEHAFDKIKKKYGAKQDSEVPAEGLEALCSAYQAVYRAHVGSGFPQNPYEQLRASIEAVFRSWNAPRAVSYRRINQISGLVGTAVNVQAMVFGNLGEDSGTGVAFTRNPSTGKNEFYGEFLINAQGEDVVAGIRTPRPVSEMRRWNAVAYDRLIEIKEILERHYRDLQDIEFTIERNTLYMLQTRAGKRTARAAVKVAVDMAAEGLIDQNQALRRVPAGDLTQLLLPSFTEAEKKKAKILARGLPASPGAATGALAFSADEAVKRTMDGESVLLVRKETSPEDIEGMHHAVGILTSTGGMTSHAAVVARGWGKCCVAGAAALSIDANRRRLTIGKKSYTHKDTISIDGATGEIMLGEVKRSEPRLSADFTTLMGWADSVRTMGVRTNADTPADARRARGYGAEGIGLCRTEHMFFDQQRIGIMRQMILAEEREDREAALKKLLPFQRRDFIKIFTAMKGLPVTVRLLDPPLHEFVPHDAETQRELARETGVTLAAIRRRVSALIESNPMLGHRGCRLSVTYPEILVMQVTAIVEAAIACKRKRIDARPEIMIPLVGMRSELETLRPLTEKTIERTRKASKYSGTLEIPIGTMIEVPRAALVAGEIAACADFFSFGTNDLTQLTFGFSRDDVAGFLPDYLDRDLLPRDPFQSLDVSGVGSLVETACRLGREARSSLKLGVCGEHGGDPDSVRFFHGLGLDYVSCSPFRVPIARLVAAQAALEAEGRGCQSGHPTGHLPQSRR